MNSTLLQIELLKYNLREELLSKDRAGKCRFCDNINIIMAMKPKTNHGLFKYGSENLKKRVNI